MHGISDLKVLIACTGVLAIKFYASTFIQGGKRFAAGTRPPEDQSLSLNKKNQKQSFGVRDPNAKDEDDENTKKPVRVQPPARAIEEDLRWERLVRNDLENIPIGLLISWAAVNSGGNPLVNSGAIIVFTVSRVAHTIAYAKGVQPHRAIAWTAGVLSTLVLVGNSIHGIITN
ncbi:hypothetical protein THRCLA_10247 [Thraustotheca clavata]|uniref:Microsomal glutathione S-transferase 1 n=1 Tax=Thraustotheca clavata TaxID=74557 RepID=A0A1V9YSI5_9STRA|nr:hypothetical protein THRCLA_10247 [Thraustotheca clavata]